MRGNIKTQFGEYAVFVSDQGVCKLFLPNNLTNADDFEKELDRGCRSARMEEIAEMVGRELLLYHEGKLKEFSVPVAPFEAKISPFRRRVWEIIKTIPYGATWNYGDLARAAGSTSGRAIGGACSDNPVPLLIPCHRVIASNGSIGSYGGGKRMKLQLLELEKNVLNGSRPVPPMN